MTSLVINSDTSLQSVIGVLRELYQAHRFVKVSAKTGKSRSVPQNSISHAWYEQLSRELREASALDWKCFCKLNYGVPILRAEDEEFRDFYDRNLKKSLTYEQKLAAMKYLPVTSLMTKSQLSAYLEAMRESFVKRGVMLEFPESAE